MTFAPIVFKNQKKEQLEYQCGNIFKFLLFIRYKQAFVELIKLIILLLITKGLEPVFVKEFAWIFGSIVKIIKHNWNKNFRKKCMNFSIILNYKKCNVWKINLTANHKQVKYPKQFEIN